MTGALELLVRSTGETVELLSPGVGLFTEALPSGRVLSAGQPAGHLITLGKATPLVVPSGVHGVVRSKRPERVHAPVGYADVLYELAKVTDESALGDDARPSDAGATAGALVVVARSAGRFWHRPSPGEPALAKEGQELSSGTPLGLLEVMKTFAHVTYQPGSSADLPARARVVKMLAGDGADVVEGDALVQVEAL